VSSHTRRRVRAVHAWRIDGAVFAFTRQQMPTALQTGRMPSRIEGDGRLRRPWKPFIASPQTGRRSSEESLDAFAPIGCAATAAGALVALGVIAFKRWIGVSVFLGHDQLVMRADADRSDVLAGLALITNGPPRIFVDGEGKKERL
jgi:hypothetical protein